MPSTDEIQIERLTLDLSNFRTPVQTSEAAALKAMVAVNPKAFWALTESLLDSGFLPTENIVVLKSGKDLVVKEGNRRVAAIKLALGELRTTGLDVPDEIDTKLKSITEERKASIKRVPCAVFDKTEADVVDRIVAMTHGKGMLAGRTSWNAVAKARHNRDQSNAPETGLDLLEAYLKSGQNLSTEEKGRWGGDYPLSVLDETIQKLVQRTGHGKSAVLVAAYPGKLTATDRKGLEALLHAIGTEELGFSTLRNEGADILKKYGFPAKPTTSDSDEDEKSGETKSDGSDARGKSKRSTKGITTGLNDPKSVLRFLRGMSIKGAGREKVETLRREAVSLNIPKTPLAFCFVLRSMFELSAKAYCKDHKHDGLSSVENHGLDKKLVDVLREVAAHLKKHAAPQDAAQLNKMLHGAMAELAGQNRFLSVGSMNQLIHSSHFSVAPPDICILFHNVAPLLEAMNA